LSELQSPAVLFAAAVLAITFFWSYWPTLAGLAGAWDREADYSHGYLVVPLALYFLWVRRDTFPGATASIAWPGIGLLALSVVMRIVGSLIYLDAADAWSILLFLAGGVWLLWGFAAMKWSLPSILFLFFMIPLPFRVERWFSLPLQRVATKLSCWTLQCLGQPALAEGNTILVNDFHMEIEQACSGLRIFMGVVALAFAYVILTRRAWWVKLLLIAISVPIAIVANSTRIVVTGLLYQCVSSHAAERFTHDAAGWLMIPFAAALFAAFLWYLGRLLREVEQLGMAELAHASRDWHK
jgi:exosortase